ncbi:MAG: cytochrome c biogenesis protein CcdA [Candidatus Fermentibacter sp.]|nr:cytochrome c biogenesis protein CcdA [Candidatus Fermentibacter sp.]
MNEFLTGLGRAVESPAPFIGLVAALLWGVLSIALSPCHLASIPLLVGYISKEPEASTKKAFRISASFACGVFLAVAALGAITLGAGRIAGDIGHTGGIILSVLMILFGLNLVEVFTIPAPARTMPGRVRSGLPGAALYGLVFGAAAGPCTFAFIAPLLGVILAAQASRPAFAAGMMGAFAAGHCGVILLAGTFSGAVCRFLNWNEKSGRLAGLRRIAGALVILAGIYLLRKAL